MCANGQKLAFGAVTVSSPTAPARGVATRDSSTTGAGSTCPMVRGRRGGGSVPTKRVVECEHWVFVYGTLKRSWPNAHLLKDSCFEGEYTTEERYPLVVGGEYFSPYLLNRSGSGFNVRGEVYRVNDTTLAKLDELERVGVNYTRKLVSVHCTDKGRRNVYAYLKCNYTQDLLNKEYLPEYRDRRYVARHLRPDFDTAPAMARTPALATAKA